MNPKELESDPHRQFPGKSVLVTGQLFSEAEHFVYYSAYRFINSERGSSAIWVSTDMPYEKIKEKFSDYGFQLEQPKGYEGGIHIIDMISHKAGVSRKNCGDCKYIHDPSNLTDLALAINEIISKKKCGLIILDSLNSLLVYNDLTKTLQFLRFLSASVYERKMTLLTYFVSGERDPRIETSIKMAVDAVVMFENDRVFLHSGSSQKSFRFDFSKGKLKLSHP